MSWKLLSKHAWQPPLALAARCNTGDMALLYSGRQETRTGNDSYLFLDPADHVEGSHWAELPTVDDSGVLPDWVGYIGYGMRCDDGFARGAAAPITLPDFRLTRYSRLFRFDHANQHIEEYGRFTATTPLAIPPHAATPFTTDIASLGSGMDRARYEVGSSRVDLQACKLEYSIVSPK